MSEHLMRIRETRTQTGKLRWLATCSCGWARRSEPISKIAAEEFWVDHFATAPRPCPTPQKKAFPRESDATAAMHRFWSTGRGKGMPIRVYKCRCKRWHTTHRELAGVR